jgi:hypothetical protein
MRHLRWLPFTFLADVHGFAIFAPYAALMMAVALFAAHRQRERAGRLGMRIRVVA